MTMSGVARIVLVLLVGLLLAGCQADDEEEIVESVYRSLVKLTTGDSADSDNFGFAVSLDGDDALVGAPGADGTGADRGEAYFFLKSQGGLDGWGQVKTLVPGDAANGDYFGIAVDISGDYAVVGAVGENGSGSDQGAAYVFSRDQGGAGAWGQVKKLVASDRADGDGFGYAVAIDGDTIVVGSDGEDGAGTNRGAAYVFARDQGGADNWGQVVKLVSPDPADSDQFGYAVSVQGGRILVGAPFEDGDGSARGAAYLFDRDLGGPGAWGLAKKLLPGDPTDDSWFGSSLGIDGPLAIVGEPWNDGGGANRGAVHVFGRDQGGADAWGPVAMLTASDAMDDDFFGYSLSVNGTNVVIGASHARGGGTERGQAYVFARDEGGADNWGEVQRLRAGDGANSDWFGFSSAILGSYIIIGAVGEDGSGTDQGAAYLFKKI
ncbi:MAG TPA: hypothetical protein ENO03_03465 [Candidatus Aminicenantes bacterium]|nr:hypothetical protein [Candidatus Aminicenantes bacterium]